MLKNLKVGTKLVAILVAPVLVLLLLAFVGVNQRLNEASEAQRVSELTDFTASSARLVKELQLEGFYSAVYASMRSSPRVSKSSSRVPKPRRCSHDATASCSGR